MIVIVKSGGFDNATATASGSRNPVLDRVNQDLLYHLATEEGPPIYTLTPDEAPGRWMPGSSILATTLRHATLIEPRGVCLADKASRQDG
jgi:hypothetical protein